MAHRPEVTGKKITATGTVTATDLDAHSIETFCIRHSISVPQYYKMTVAYVDYSSMEFLIAASLSDGHCGPVNKMLDMYRSGDPYLSFAKSVGAVPKDGHQEISRDGARPLQDHAAVGAVRPVSDVAGGAAQHPVIRCPRDAQPAPPVIRAILGLVR